MSNLDAVIAVFDDKVRCRWWEMCGNYADGYITGLLLGDVWACRQCADAASETLHPWEE